MKYNVECPYCYEWMRVEEFGLHVFHEHHEIECPKDVDIEYFKQRYLILSANYEAYEEQRGVWDK